MSKSREKPPFPVDAVWVYCSALRATGIKQYPAKPEQQAIQCPLTLDLKFSMRSVACNIPWVRNLIVVLADDDCAPGWLNTKDPRVHIVKHAQIMPKSSLPCFNSNVIESYVHRIPGLSDQFLFLNDDTHIAVPTAWSAFFTPEGLPINRHYRGPPDHPVDRDSSIMFVKMMQHAIKAYGMHYTRYQHQVQPASKTLMRYYERRFASAMRESLTHRHRQADDFNLIRFATCFSTSEGKAPHIKTGERTDYFAEAADEEAVMRIPTAGKKGQRPPRFICINNGSSKYDYVYAVLDHLFPVAAVHERGSSRVV